MTIIVVLVVLLVAIPTALYWALERRDMYLRWDLDSRYAQQFYFETDYAAGLLKGDIGPATNLTLGIASNDVSGANIELSNIAVLDTTHANQLYKISYALSTLTGQANCTCSEDYFQSLNSSQRATIATQLRLVGHDVVNAYWNYVNYTSNGVGQGPDFWYSGPAPPDSKLMQDAVIIALDLQRK